MCHIGTWSTWYCMRTAEKSLEVKNKKKYGLPSIKKWHSANHHLAECLPTVNGGGPLPSVLVCRVPDTWQTWSLSSVIVCWVLGTWQTTSLPSASCLPSAFSLALSKYPLCRAPDKKHSAKKPSPVVWGSLWSSPMLTSKKTCLH